MTKEYVVGRPLGEGGHGQVFEAHSADAPGVIVALKRLRQGDVTDDAERRRFLREMALLETLSHPDVVRFIDWGSDYLVMEFCPWRPLRARLMDGPVPNLEAIRIAIRIADVLAYLHSRSVFHRDIKPENILVDGDQIKLVDFGVSFHQRLPASQVGSFAGTPIYAPPEALTHSASDSALQHDLYALGVVLFEMLTGERPFRSPERASSFANVVALKCRTPHLDPGPRFAAETRLVVRRLTALDAADRPSSALDVANLLRQLPASPVVALADKTIFVSEHNNGENMNSWLKSMRRRRTDFLVGGFSTLVGATAAALWALTLGPATPPVPTPMPVPVVVVPASPAEARRSVPVPSEVRRVYTSCSDLADRFPDAPIPPPDATTDSWTLYCAGLVYRAEAVLPVGSG